MILIEPEMYLGNVELPSLFPSRYVLFASLHLSVQLSMHKEMYAGTNLLSFSQGMFCLLLYICLCNFLFKFIFCESFLAMAFSLSIRFLYRVNTLLHCKVKYLCTIQMTSCFTGLRLAKQEYICCC